MQNEKAHQNLSWKAQSHVRHKRSNTWYLGFFLIIIGLIGFAYYIQSITAGITFVMIAVVLLITGSQNGKEIEYHITKTGIVAGEILYPFKVIKKFWIIYHPPHIKTLNFETTAYLNNRITIQLGKQDPIQIKNTLSKYLPEDIDKEESITETLARTLKI